MCPWVLGGVADLVGNPLRHETLLRGKNVIPAGVASAWWVGRLALCAAASIARAVAVHAVVMFTHHDEFAATLSNAISSRSIEIDLGHYHGDAGFSLQE